jgi:hypothetical protein
MTTQTKLIIGGALVLIVSLLILGNVTTKKAAGMWKDTDIACLLNGHDNLAQHIHPVLSIVVDGESQTIPGNIGISDDCMAEVHTHEADGVIHIESVTPKTFVLGDFFTVWGKDIELEGYTLSVIADGAIIPDPLALELSDGQQIQIIYTSMDNPLTPEVGEGE